MTSEDNKEKQLSDAEKNSQKIEDVENSKYVEFYSQSYASFYNTTMEKDKSIMTVAAGGIGFLITFMNISKHIEIFEYIIFLLAALAFIITIFTIIHIFGKNAQYIVSVTTEAEDTPLLEGKLLCLDRTAIIAFYFGIVFSLILGITSSYKNLNQETGMSSKKETGQQNMPQTTTLNDSVAGATMFKKSFTGATNMKPQTSTQTSNTTNTTTTNQNQGKKD